MKKIRNALQIDNKTTVEILDPAIDESWFDESWFDESSWGDDEPEPQQPDTSTEDAEALASLYAALWNAIEDASGKVTQEEQSVAADELADTVWQVERDERGRWRAVFADDYTTYARDDGDLVTYAAERAPAGGISINGKQYRGGQFVPSREVAKAREQAASGDAEAKDAVERLDAAQVKHKERADARTAERKKRGPVEAGKLKERLGTHRDKVELSDADKRNAGSAWRMLRRHHGELALHRIEELAGGLERALEKLPEDEEGIRENLTRQLAALHHVVDVAHAEGYEGWKGEPKKEEAAKEPSSDAPPTDTIAKPEETSNEPARLPESAGTGRDGDGQQPVVGDADGGGNGGTPGGSGTATVVLPPPDERILTSRAERLPAVDPGVVPESLRPHLRRHQIEGVARGISALDKHGGFLLADGTGVGKSREILAVADTYAKRGKKVLIVTKAEVIKPDWKKGTFQGSFASDGKAMSVEPTLVKDQDLTAGKVHLTTYDNLSKIKGNIDENTVIVFDESHALKNWNSARSKHGYEMSKKAAAVMYATATPADKPLHIAHLFRARVFGTKSWDETYAELGMHKVTVRAPGSPKGYVEKWEIDPSVGAAECMRRMGGLFDRLTQDGLMVKREISMQGIDVGFERVELSEEAHAVLAKVKEEMDKKAGDYNPGLLRAATLMHQRRQQEPFKVAHTVDAVKRELAEGRSVVVFASRVNESEVTGETMSGLADEPGEPLDTGVSSEGTMKLLKEALGKAGIEDVLELHGGVTPAKRIKAMNDFQDGKGRVIIATVESGGTGVNLDDVAGDRPRTLLMMTAPFSAVENVQAAGRVHRLNTKSASRIRYLFGDTDVDQWNASLIAKKMGTLGAAIGGEVSRLDVPTDLTAEGIASFTDKDAREKKRAEEAAARGPYEWSRPLVRPPLSPATAAAAKQDSTKDHPLVRKHDGRVTSIGKGMIRVKTAFGESLVDDLKELGARWNKDIVRWEVPVDAEQDLDALLSRRSKLDVGYKPEHISPPPVAPAPVPTPSDPAKAEPVSSPEPTTRKMAQDRKDAIHEALRMLAGQDTDRAREINGVGFNKMDSDFGASLAAQSSLSDNQARAAAKMLRKYGKQIPAKLMEHINANDEPEQKAVAPEPAKPQPAPTLVKTRQVSTSKGMRHVYGFSPSKLFWDIRKSGRLPAHTSVSKNPRTGEWEVSVWGNSPEEVTRNVQDLKRLGINP